MLAPPLLRRGRVPWMEIGWYAAAGISDRLLPCPRGRLEEGKGKYWSKLNGIKKIKTEDFCFSKIFQMGFCFLKPLWCPLWFLYDSTYVFQVKKNFSLLYSQVSTCSRHYWGVLMLLTVHTITYLDVYVCSTSNGNMWCLVHHCMDFPLQFNLSYFFEFFLIGVLWVWTGFVHTTCSYNTTAREGEDNYFWHFLSWEQNCFVLIC